MYKQIGHNMPFMYIGIAVGYAILLALAVLTNVNAAVGIAAVPFIAWVVLRRPKAALVLLLFSLPFQSAPILAQNILGVTGMKPVNLLAAVAIVVLFLKEGNMLRFQDIFEKKALLILSIYMLVFSIMIFRSVDNLNLFHRLLPGQFQSSATNYLLSFYVKPSLYVLSFLLVLKMFQDTSDWELVVNTVCFAVFMLSLVVVVAGFSHFSEFSQGRSVIRDICATTLGLHYNNIATLYISAMPLLVLQALKKNVFHWLNGGLALLALVILQSRTGLLASLAGSIFLLYKSGAKKTLVGVGLLFLVALTLGVSLPESITQNFMTGAERGTVDALLSGREEHIWLPLLSEWLAGSAKFLFGAGRYGIMTSTLWVRGVLLPVTHAHNAFIDFFLDSGIILTGILVGFLLYAFYTAWEISKEIDTPLIWALFTSLVAYLFGTITGRCFYPATDNILVWPVLGLFVNLVRYYGGDARHFHCPAGGS